MSTHVGRRDIKRYISSSGYASHNTNPLYMHTKYIVLYLN